MEAKLVLKCTKIALWPIFSLLELLLLSSNGLGVVFTIVYCFISTIAYAFNKFVLIAVENCSTLKYHEGIKV